jgi:hypothetical protein
LIDRIQTAIKPFDVAGLSHLDRNQWYPAFAEDFLDSAHKLGVTRDEAELSLIKAGFFDPRSTSMCGATGS